MLIKIYIIYKGCQKKFVWKGFEILYIINLLGILYLNFMSELNCVFKSYQSASNVLNR